MVALRGVLARRYGLHRGQPMSGPRSKLPRAAAGDVTSHGCEFVRTPVGATAARADIARRHERIGRLFERGVPSAAIVECVVTEFGVSERTARGDVALVRRRWATIIASEEPDRRQRLLRYLDAVAAEAFEDRAWGACVAAAREISRVLGIGIDVTAVHVSAGEPKQLAHLRVLAMTPAQRLQRRLELASKAYDPQQNGGPDDADS